MNKSQVLKTLKVLLITTAILIGLELIFMIPAVEQFFASWFSASGWTLYLVVWVLMFLQANILNIPAVTLLELSIVAGINTLSVEYIVLVMSAYMTGCIVSYFLGRKFGSKAIKWIAGNEEDFNKWCEVINKKGKWWYFATVILPLFPDDVIVFVCGSIKFDFTFFVISNLIGRTIGLITMLFTLKLLGHIGGNFPTMLVVWCVGLIAELVAYIIIKTKMNKYAKND